MWGLGVVTLRTNVNAYRLACSKSDDGFLPWNCRDRTGFQLSFPSIRFPLPSFLDLGV